MHANVSFHTRKNPAGFSVRRRGDLQSLYLRFMDSPNFEWWLREKVRSGSRRVRTLYIEQLMQADMEEWMKSRDDIEAVDLILRLKELLVCWSLLCWVWKEGGERGEVCERGKGGKDLVAEGCH